MKDQKKERKIKQNKYIVNHAKNHLGHKKSNNVLLINFASRFGALPIQVSKINMSKRYGIPYRIYLNLFFYSLSVSRIVFVPISETAFFTLFFFICFWFHCFTPTFHLLVGCFFFPYIKSDSHSITDCLFISPSLC